MVLPLTGGKPLPEPTISMVIDAICMAETGLWAVPDMFVSSHPEYAMSWWRHDGHR